MHHMAEKREWLMLQSWRELLVQYPGILMGSIKKRREKKIQNVVKENNYIPNSLQG